MLPMLGVLQAGQYCAVCKRVWLPLEKDMASCERCNFWVHSTCDSQAMDVVKVCVDIAHEPFYYRPTAVAPLLCFSHAAASHITNVAAPHASTMHAA